METLALEIINLTKHFRKEARGTGNRNGLWKLAPKAKAIIRVVDSVNLAVERGEIFGILGPNGSGKSTLIRIIATLLLPDEGSAWVFGHNVVKEPEAVQRLISRVSADAAFFRQMSAVENLLHTARLYGVPLHDARLRIEDLMNRLDMKKDKLNTPMHELSRGMQQKVAVTRALLTSPSLLLLDEPTTGLDPKSKREVQRFIKEEREMHGATVLLTTHDMEEAEVLCDRIAILNSGKIVALGTANELKTGCDACGASPTMEDVFLALAGRSLRDEGEEEN